MPDIQNIDNLNEVISTNLKRLRKDRGLTLDQVAECTGVSKSMLGQIERGESSPSVSTLWKISTGLKISFTSLMVASSKGVKIIDNYAVAPLTNGTEHFKLYPVFPCEPGRNFEVLHIDIKPGAVSPSSPHETGTEEFILVYNGTLSLELGGQNYEIPENHSIRYPADQNHSYANNGSETVHLCMVIYYAV